MFDTTANLHLDLPVCAKPTQSLSHLRQARSTHAVTGTFDWPSIDFTNQQGCQRSWGTSSRHQFLSAPVVRALPCFGLLCHPSFSASTDVQRWVSETLQAAKSAPVDLINDLVKGKICRKPSFSTPKPFSFPEEFPLNQFCDLTKRILVVLSVGKSAIHLLTFHEAWARFRTYANL